MSTFAPLATGSTVQTVFVAVTLVLGYVAIFLLWWFVFREKKER